MVQCLTAFVIKSEPEFHSQNLHVGGRDQLLQAMFNLYIHDWYFCAPHTQNKRERERVQRKDFSIYILQAISPEDSSTLL